MAAVVDEPRARVWLEIEGKTSASCGTRIVANTLRLRHFTSARATTREGTA